MKTFDFESGHLALDFANTLDQDAAGNNVEILSEYTDLLDWSQASSMAFSDAQAQNIRERAVLEPALATETLETAHHVREVIYRLFAAAAAGEFAPAHDLDTFNRYLERALPWLRLTVEDNAYGLNWAESNHFDQVLCPVIWSATQLLVSDDLSRVKQCGSGTCNYLFYDSSRNRSRRWCSMESCGNRAKVRRHYHKRRVED